MKTKTLLLGWDSADWQIIDPLLRDGKMPVLQSLIRTGVRGNIATLSPSLSPLLWTSIATGKRAYDHGIHGFVENDPESGEVLPVRSTTRKAKALWNIFNEAGLTTNVINWWPSHPAEKVNGVYVSNHFHKSAPATGEPWPLDNSCTWPPEWEDRLKDLRVYPGELTLAHIAPFVPEAHRLNPEKEPVLSSLVRVLAHCASIHNAATEVMEQSHWDFMAVYQEALDHFAHLAMRYHPPRLAGVDQEEYELYKGVMEAAYRFHDMMLGRLVELAGPNCNILLLSDHGFHSGQLRQADLPDLPAAPAMEHRKYGIFLAHGPDFKAGEQVYGASLLDVAPTLLHLHQLPAGEDMEGRVLQSLFKEQRPVSVIPSWEITGSQPAFREEKDAPSGELLQQLQDLGYVSLPHNDKQKYVQRELEYNLCVSLMEGRRWDEVKQRAREHLEKDKDWRFGILLIDALMQTNQRGEAGKLLVQMEEVMPESGSYLYLHGLWYLRGGDTEKALTYFRKIENTGVASVQLLVSIGRSLLVAGELVAARDYFEKVLELDPDNAPALTGKAECLLESGFPGPAMEALDKSLQLSFYQPHAHYLMAQAALQLHREDLATQALDLCLHQAPQHARARQLNGSFAPRPQEASPPIIIVSGFPRSGTSMLMQMLREGGVPVFEDENRPADEHNPLGYHEHSRVKKLGEEQDWLQQARGKALKVVSPLLRYLPADEKYRVLLIQRPLTEVIVSQEVMRGHKREEVMRNFPFQKALELQQEETRILNRVQMQPNMQLLTLDYYRCLDEPEAVVREIEDFLGLKLKRGEAVSAVNAKLHRNKLAGN